ncbi:glycosyl hydrolase [Nonomuraea sp. NPDC046802]|uniref:glycosyl hydrolase n=1 Tax=Nonomuraea sp. NPDC046802 TaxID=3154919 RepID=UPI003409A5A1
MFEEPPRDFGPTPLWWWSGAKVTRERLEWQMRRFAAGGVHNLVVINLAPAGPAFGAQADDPAWFSDEWWARFTDACDIARRLGMRLWFYDQIGFSSANVQGGITHRHPEAAGRALRCERAVVTGGRAEMLATECLIGAYSQDGRRVHLPDTPDGTDVLLITSVPTAFDYLAPHAVDLLMDTIHGEFDRRVPQYLGNVVAGSFQDELPATNSWTAHFPEEFMARRGYDLLEHLPALFLRGDRQAAKVRTDYYAVRAELTEEALFKPLGDWHEARGMLVGADPTHPARSGYPTQSTQIYTDYFRTHRWYSAAGNDHEGDSKVHSSMAHLYGHERVWIEAFHSSGWGGTPAETYDWLLPFLRAGANLYNPHASYFGTAGGWFEWAPPSTDWRQPYWKQYPAFSRAVSRIASIMSWGVYSASVAVLHPTTSAQALLPLDVPVDHFGDGYLGDEDLDAAQHDYLRLCGTNGWFHTRIGELDRRRIAFDVIDDDSLQRAEITAGAVHVAGLRYAAVLLPSASVLEEGTARQLIALLDAGGRVVVVGRMPSFAAGMNGNDSVIAALAAHPRLERAADAESGAKAVADLTDYATGDVPLLVRRIGTEAVALVTGAFPNASAHPPRDASQGMDYDFDPARYAAVSTVRVNAVVAEAELWNPVTGARLAADVTVSGHRSTIKVPLDGAPAAIVVWREGEAPPAAPKAPAPATIATDLSSGWYGRLVPTMDNTWGDMALPAEPVDQLQIWSFTWQNGDTEQAARATYGNRVRVLGPVPAEQAPAALDREAVGHILAGEWPLVDDDAGWEVSLYSSSRGAADPGRGTLGHKGLVNEEFIRVGRPEAGTISRVRAIVETDRLGAAELIVGAAAGKRLWWNGVELPTGNGYLARARIDIDQRLNVIEYELSDAEIHVGLGTPVKAEPLGSFFCLTRPGEFSPRPQFMRLPPAVRPDGRVAYRARVRLRQDAAEGVLIVGAATGVTVFLDGAVVARQERVEYYGSAWAATPDYFRHDLSLEAGEHLLEIVADSTQARDVVYVDLVARTESSVVTLVSGPGWEAETGGWRGRTIEHRGRWAELQPCHAAVRPHPLHGTEWLHGAPHLGAAVDAIRVTDDIAPTPQRLRTTLPAGAISLHLPLRLGARVLLDGVEAQLGGTTLDLGRPLQVPTTLEIVTEPTAILRGGGVLSGPVTVRTVEAPVPLGNWHAMGLAGWSGGMRYSRTVSVPSGSDPVLDLGRVRGTVEVAVDGEKVGETFCGPYRFPLPGTAGRTVQIDITVYNTLAPFLHESTPTAWTFPSQLVSGLLGPVTLLHLVVSALPLSPDDLYFP